MVAAALALEAATGVSMTPMADRAHAKVAQQAKPQQKQSPEKPASPSMQRFFAGGWTRGAKAQRGKRVRRSVAQDRRVARKARNVKKFRRSNR